MTAYDGSVASPDVHSAAYVPVTWPSFDLGFGELASSPETTSPPGSGVGYVPPTTGQLWPRGFPGLPTGGGGDGGGEGVVTLVTPTSADGGSSLSSVSVSAPSSSLAGDIFVVMAASNGRTLTPPSGFTQVRVDDYVGVSSHLYTGLWWKRLTSDGATTATINIGSATKFRAAGVTLRGAGDPVLLGEAQATGSITATPAVDGYGLWFIAWDPTYIGYDIDPSMPQIVKGYYCGAWAETLTAGVQVTRDSSIGGDKIMYGLLFPPYTDQGRWVDVPADMRWVDLDPAILWSTYTTPR